MLGKLLKYDGKESGKKLLPYYGILLLISFVVIILDNLASHFAIIGVMSSFMNVIFVIGCIGLFFYTLYVAVKTFHQDLFKDEGYLTHTLPVTKQKLLLSRLIISFLYLTLSIFVFVLAYKISGFSLTLINEVMHTIAVNFHISTTSIWVIMIITLYFSYFTFLLNIYAAISLGYSRNDHKMMYTFVFGILIYTLSQVIGLIGLGILYILDPNVFELEITNNMMDIKNYVIDVLWVSLATTIVFLVACYYTTILAMKKGLNLE